MKLKIIIRTSDIISTVFPTNYYPMKVLHAILIARYPDRAAGKWVVMKATIAEVDLYIMAYGWSNCGIAYFVSTCGTTIRHEIDYRTSFDDGFGNISSKPLPRPSIAHFLYEFLPLIDEHNKARQSALALEEKWPTKCCWFRLLTTFIGMAVVDVQRWDRNMRANQHMNTRRTVAQILKVGADADPKECFNIITMADLIAKPLRTCEFRFWGTEDEQARWQKSQRETQQTRLSAAGGQGRSVLIRYLKNGEFNNSKGKAYQRYCYICRTYGTMCNTQWVCRACGMPLCKKGRRGLDNGCIDEHFNPQQPNDGCYDRPGDGFIVPKGSLKKNPGNDHHASNNAEGNDRVGNKSNSRTGKNSRGQNRRFDTSSDEDADDDGNGDNDAENNNDDNDSDDGDKSNSERNQGRITTSSRSRADDIAKQRKATSNITTRSGRNQPLMRAPNTRSKRKR